MKQTARVIRIDSPTHAEVMVRRSSACASAHNCGSCDHCSMMENAPEIIVKAENLCGAKVGDTVSRVSLPVSADPVLCGLFFWRSV